MIAAHQLLQLSFQPGGPFAPFFKKLEEAVGIA